MMSRYSRQNAALAALARKDSLALTPQQIKDLQAVVDSDHALMQPHIDSLIAAVTATDKAATSANPVPLLTQIQAVNQLEIREQASIRAQVQKILTDVQWALMPANVVNPGFGGRGGAAGGAAGGGRGGRGGRGGGGDLDY
jgi:hypothetical protein